MHTRPLSRKYVNFSCVISQLKKNTFPSTIVVLRVLLNMHQNCFRPGICPGPCWRSLRWRRETPSPHSPPPRPRRLRPLDLGAFRASLLAPPIQIPGYATSPVKIFRLYATVVTFVSRWHAIQASFGTDVRHSDVGQRRFCVGTGVAIAPQFLALHPQIDMTQQKLSLWIILLHCVDRYASESEICLLWRWVKFALSKVSDIRDGQPRRPQGLWSIAPAVLEG